jgi:circadian clock protein KaiC
VRELVLGDSGVTLADVYVEGGDVLMGTARYQREIEALSEEDRSQRQAIERRMELERQRAEMRRRMLDLERQLEAHEVELDRLAEAQDLRRSRRLATREEIRRLRGGGRDARSGAEASGA